MKSRYIAVISILFLTMVLTGCDLQKEKENAHKKSFIYSIYGSTAYYSDGGDLYSVKLSSNMNKRTPEKLMEDVQSFSLRWGRFYGKKYQKSSERRYVNGLLETDRAYVIKKDNSLWSWNIGKERSDRDVKGGYYYEREPLRMMENVREVFYSGGWDIKINSVVYALKMDDSLWRIIYDMDKEQGEFRTEKVLDSVKTVFYCDINGYMPPHAVQKNGTLWDLSSQTVKMKNVRTYQASNIDGHYTHYVIDTKNHLWAWGEDIMNSFALGRPLTKAEKNWNFKKLNKYKPRIIMKDVGSIDWIGWYNDYHSPFRYVTKTDGSLWVWGDKKAFLKPYMAAQNVKKVFCEKNRYLTSDNELMEITAKGKMKLIYKDVIDYRNDTRLDYNEPYWDLDGGTLDFVLLKNGELHTLLKDKYLKENGDRKILDGVIRLYGNRFALTKDGLYKITDFQVGNPKPVKQPVKVLTLSINDQRG